MSEKKQIIKEVEDMMRTASRLSERIRAYSDGCHAYFAMNRAWKELGDARDFFIRTPKDRKKGPK